MSGSSCFSASSTRRSSSTRRRLPIICGNTAAYLAAVCILPEILISQYSVPFYFGGTSLLIVVSVTMDTVAQIHSHLLAHQYEGLIKKSRLRGRRGET